MKISHVARVDMTAARLGSRSRTDVASATTSDRPETSQFTSKKEKGTIKMIKASKLITHLALSLVLSGMSDYTHASGKKADYGIGSDWDGESLGSLGFSDTASSYGGGNTREQKLDELSGIRKHMFKGSLEITPNNLASIQEHTVLYESSFGAYDRGVFVKAWKASLGTDQLLEILLKFTHITKFKFDVIWDKDVDLSETISRSVQFFSDLGELSIAGCRLTDQGMDDVIESIQNPDKLKILDIKSNGLTSAVVLKIRERFTKLID